MKSSLLFATLALVLPAYLLGAEPSAFGAGDINKPNPYGLTSSEELLLQTKKNLKKVVVKTNNQANEVDSLRERIDGLQSIIESLSMTARKNKLELKELSKKDELKSQNRDEFDKRFGESLELNAKNIELNKQEIEKARLIVEELSKLVDKINASYVTKDEYNTLVDDFNKFKKLVAKELKNAYKPKKSKLDSMSNGDVATKAKQYYDKKHYTKALEYYNHLIKKKYKPARSHYMVGEIYYYRKDYANAIAYFKKSASLYSKANYMPVLLLHTAISMDRTGDKKNAKSFYNAVIKKYPSSNSANIAKDRLSKLN
jgi:TolA-binding protein